jgi:hypothetical protein
MCVASWHRAAAWRRLKCREALHYSSSSAKSVIMHAGQAHLFSSFACAGFASPQPAAAADALSRDPSVELADGASSLDAAANAAARSPSATPEATAPGDVKQEWTPEREATVFMTPEVSPEPKGGGAGSVSRGARARAKADVQDVRDASLGPGVSAGTARSSAEGGGPWVESKEGIKADTDVLSQEGAHR